MQATCHVAVVFSRAARFDATDQHAVTLGEVHGLGRVVGDVLNVDPEHAAVDL